MHKLLYIILLSFCSVECCLSQSTNYLFQHLGTDKGLSQQNTFTVCQDQRGFFWMISSNSIQRYDGSRFLNFLPGVNSALPVGSISSALLDKKDRLWVIISNRTLGYFDTRYFTFHPVRLQLPSSFTDAGAALILDKEDNIFVVYPGRGFLTYNEKANEASRDYNPFVLPAGYEPRHWICDEEMNYWLSTAGGFVKFNARKKILSYAGHNTENDAFINAFANEKNSGVVYKDRSNRMWATYRDANLKFFMRSFEPSGGKMKAWEDVIAKAMNGQYAEFWGLHDFGEDGIWIGGPGLFAKLFYNEEKIELVAPEQAGQYSIRYDGISSLFKDRERSIWVCTDKGIYRFNPSAHLFHVITNRVPGIEKEFSNSVTGFLETNDGEILVSTWGEGIFSYDRNFKPGISKYVQRSANYEAMVWCLLQTSNGDIWRGGQEGTLYIYDAATRKTSFLKPAECNKRTIRQLVEDKSGNVWLGTQGGQLVKWSTSDKKFHLQRQFKRLISRLYVDKANNIWVCTDMEGVYHIKGTDGSTIAHYTTEAPGNKKILINGATDVLQYNDTTIVIASNGLNILNTKSGTFNYLDVGASISTMLLDKKGRFWFSEGNGIFNRDLSKPNVPIRFDARDGISNTGFHVAAATVLSDGRILFGTNNNFITFNPDKALSFDFPIPDVQVADISVMDKQLSVDSILKLGKLEVKHSENSISLQVTTNNIQNQFSIYYKLENEDKQWKYTNGDLSFNYLPPGKYTLLITAQGIDGKQGKIFTLGIHVAAPFYRTWWFYCSVALLCAALLFWYDRERIKRNEVLQRVRSEIAGNLHHEVHSALQNINILSEMAKRKADSDIDKSKEFIEQIHGKSQTMLVAMDDMLWSIDPENDSMDKTILRMQEFAENLSNQHHTRITLVADDKLNSVNFSMQLRHDAFILFRESLRKLATSGAGECNAHIGTERNHLVFSVECMSGHFNLQQMNSLLQVNEMGVRAKKINAVLYSEEKQNYTVFIVKVPIR